MVGFGEIVGLLFIQALGIEALDKELMLLMECIERLRCYQKPLDRVTPEVNPR